MIEKICEEIGVAPEELIIKQLQQENNQLKEEKTTFEVAFNLAKRKEEEYEFILKELRSWLEKLGNCDIYTSEILSKLNELEGGKNEK